MPRALQVVLLEADSQESCERLVNRSLAALAPTDVVDIQHGIIVQPDGGRFYWAMVTVRREV